MVKCLNIGKNIGKPIYRSISTCAQCTFLNIKPKISFNVTIDEDCMIFEKHWSLNARYLKCAKSIFAIFSL